MFVHSCEIGHSSRTVWVQPNMEPAKPHQNHALDQIQSLCFKVITRVCMIMIILPRPHLHQKHQHDHTYWTCIQTLFCLLPGDRLVSREGCRWETGDGPQCRPRVWWQVCCAAEVMVSSPVGAVCLLRGGVAVGAHQTGTGEVAGVLAVDPAFLFMVAALNCCLRSANSDVTLVSVDPALVARLSGCLSPMSTVLPLPHRSQLQAQSQGFACWHETGFGKPWYRARHWRASEQSELWSGAEWGGKR